MDNEASQSEEARDGEIPPQIDSPAPVVPVWEDIAPKAQEKTSMTPASVKIAALFLVAHGVGITLNALYGWRQTGNMSGVPYAVIWLGVMIVVCGALCERQAWAWWLVTIFGGMIGIFNLMKVVAFSLYRAGGVIEDDHSFSPLLIGAAGVAMLLAVILLLMPDAKAAFGMKPKSGGLS